MHWQLVLENPECYSQNYTPMSRIQYRFLQEIGRNHSLKRLVLEEIRSVRTMNLYISLFIRGVYASPQQTSEPQTLRLRGTE